MTQNIEKDKTLEQNDRNGYHSPLKFSPTRDRFVTSMAGSTAKWHNDY